MIKSNSFLLKFKKHLIIALLIVLVISTCFTVNKLFDSKFINFISERFLYLVNSKDIQFNNITLEAPFYYKRKISNDTLTLTKFPEFDTIITLIKSAKLTKDISYNNFKETFYSIDFVIEINEGDIFIDGEKGHFLNAVYKSNPSIYKADIIIPNKKYILSFIGNKKYSKDFWNIARQIRFNKQSKGPS